MRARASESELPSASLLLQVPTTAETGLGQSCEPGTQSRSLTWLVPLPRSTPAGSWSLGIRARYQTTVVWYVWYRTWMSNQSLNHQAKHPPLFILLIDCWTQCLKVCFYFLFKVFIRNTTCVSFFSERMIYSVMLYKTPAL